MSMGMGDIVTALLKQAKSRGLAIKKGHGSISRVGQEMTWLLKSITRISDGLPVPDKIVSYSSLTGWKWTTAGEAEIE